MSSRPAAAVVAAARRGARRGRRGRGGDDRARDPKRKIGVMVSCFEMVVTAAAGSPSRAASRRGAGSVMSRRRRATRRSVPRSRASCVRRGREIGEHADGEAAGRGSESRAKTGWMASRPRSPRPVCTSLSAAVAVGRRVVVAVARAARRAGSLASRARARRCWRRRGRRRQPGKCQAGGEDAEESRRVPL